MISKELYPFLSFLKESGGVWTKICCCRFPNCSKQFGINSFQNCWRRERKNSERKLYKDANLAQCKPMNLGYIRVPRLWLTCVQACLAHHIWNFATCSPHPQLWARESLLAFTWLHTNQYEFLLFHKSVSPHLFPRETIFLSLIFLSNICELCIHPNLQHWRCRRVVAKNKR